ncbi:MAG: CvpA family protein [Candidatus Omnitrophota bacterium]
MISDIDLLVLVVVIIAVFQGWRKGLFRSLITPASFLMGLFIGIIYYDASENIVKSLSAIAITTLGLSSLLFLLLYLSRRKMNPQDRQFIYVGSRLAGILVNGAWQGFLMGFLLFVFASFPGDLFGIPRIRTDVQQSISCQFFQFYVLNKLPLFQDIKTTISVLEDSRQVEQTRMSGEFNAFLQEEKIQSLLSDEETLSQMHNKDVLRLLNNPKFQSVMKDDRLMNKFSKIIKEIYEEKQKEKD